jgi:hypothetical protein
MDENKIKPLSNQKPLINNNIELEFEQFYSHWGEYKEGLNHIISDIKIGNLQKNDGSQENTEHCLNWATRCKSWHPNPKYHLVRSELGWLSQAAVCLSVSLAMGGFFVKEGHTIREKQHQKTEQSNNKKFGVPGFGKQPEDGSF